MEVEGFYQRCVTSCKVGAHAVFFEVFDSKGNQTDVVFNLDKLVWSCPCKGFWYDKKCGHVAECKKYAGHRDDLKELGLCE